MIKKIKNILKEEFIRGSLVLLILFGIYNVLNYIFQFSMARLLSPAEYAVLSALISLTYIFNIPSEPFQTLIVKYCSKYIKKNGKIKNLIYDYLKLGLIYSSLIYGVYLIISIFLRNILGIDYWLLALIGILIFSAFITPILRGAIQGIKKFKELGINLILESSIKLILGIILVVSGMKVYGAVFGILLGFLAAVLFSLIPLKGIFKEKRLKEETEEKYGLKVFISMTALVLMSSLDVILALALFKPEIAGQYSIASMLGKIIFFGTQAIGKAMFPLSSISHEKGHSAEGILKKALIFILVISIVVLGLYWFFAEKVILFLFNTGYYHSLSLIMLVSLSFALLSFTNILTLYYLSKKQEKREYLMILLVLGYMFVAFIASKDIVRFAEIFLGFNILMFLYAIVLSRK